MTVHIAILMGLFAGAAVLLATERIPPAVTALCLVVLLAGTGIVTPTDAFAGFASESIVILACIMILSRRLSASGVMDRLSARLAGKGNGSAAVAVARLMAATAALSTIFSNTSTTAVMKPVAIAAAKTAKSEPGRFLMPMAFASIMGGSATLIGTSTNLAANGAITQMGLEPLGLFEFFGIGLAVTLAGIATVVVTGRSFARGPALAEAPGHREASFLAVLVVPPGSEAVDTPLKELALHDAGGEPLAVDMADGRVAPHPKRKIREGDRIIVEISGADFARLINDRRFRVDGMGDDAALKDTADAVLLPGSRWIGSSVGGMRRSLAPEVAVIGVRRADYNRAAEIGRMRLRAGDVLRLVGTAQGLERVDADVDICLLRDAEPVAPSQREGLFTLGALILALALAATGLLPLSVALLVGVIGLILAGRLTLRDALNLVSWQILILIGGMSSFGLAMLQSGAADWIASGLLRFVAPYGETAILITLSLLTVLLTQPLSNAAAALTVLPIAVATASGLGVDPRALVVIVTLSASLSFVAPLEPALLLVYGEGNCRLLDFVRAGVPVTGVSLVIVLIVAPLLWPL